MKFPPIVGVTWEDAHGTDGTLSIHEIDHRPYVFTSIGFLLRSDSEGVTLAAEMGEDKKFRDFTFIPRKMILKEFPIAPKRPKCLKPSSLVALSSSPP